MRCLLYAGASCSPHSADAQSRTCTFDHHHHHRLGENKNKDMDIRHEHGADVQVVRSSPDYAGDMVAIGGMHTVQVLLAVRTHLLLLRVSDAP